MDLQFETLELKKMVNHLSSNKAIRRQINGYWKS